MKTLYQKTKTGKIQEWKIWIEIGASGFPEVFISYGHTDGKKQLTNDIINSGVNIGKANATSPLEQAKLMMERKIKKQIEKGYRESLPTTNTALGINFFERLPKELCFYKPNNSITDKKIDLLESKNNAIYTVKRDGMMHIVRKTKKFGVEIYSRRMDLVTNKYPHLVELFSNLPDDSILLGEILLIGKNGQDDFNGVSSICRSDLEKSIERQKELGRISYYIFDVAFWQGTNMLTKYTYIERHNTIIEYMKANNILNNTHLMPVEIIEYTHIAALKNVSNRNLEGLVVWDASKTMSDGEAFTFNGKAYRPNVLWKSKPKYEDDFVVDWNPANGIGEYGSGKNKGKIKNVYLYQIHNHKLVYLGKCGGGLRDEERDFFTTAKFPRVWRVEYDSIQPKTGFLRFPVFSRDRLDKSIDECIINKEILKARGVKGE